MKTTESDLYATLKNIAKMRVRLDLVRELSKKGDYEAVKRMAIAELTSFIKNEPENWRTPAGELLEAEKRERAELAESWASPGLRAYLSEKGLSMSDFAGCYANVDRKEFALAVLDAA